MSVVACASSPGAERGITGGDGYTVEFRRDASSLRRDIGATLDSTWKILPAAFKELGYSAGPSRDPSARVFFTPALHVKGQLYSGTPNSRYFDCGRASAGGHAADVYAVRFAILVQLRANRSGGTEIEVLADGTATDQSGITNPTNCSGTGKLEDNLANIIEKLATGSVLPRSGLDELQQ